MQSVRRWIGAAAHLQSPSRKEHTMTSLNGKTAIVTGASRGIGAATARALAAAGASVALAARDANALERVADEIIAAGGRALPVPTDIGEPAAVEDLVAHTV